MPTDKQIEAAANMLSRFIDLSGHTEDWVSYAVGAALTVAEQAEPPIDWRSCFLAQSKKLHAVLYIPGVKERLSEMNEDVEQLEAALEPVETATICVACEGKPSPENNPCAVCGKKSAEPTVEDKTDTEPVGKFVKTANGYHQEVDEDDEGFPLYARPPESRLSEALEEIANLKTVRDRPDDYNRGFADGRWQAVKIARAALASSSTEEKGADDERS